MPGLHIRTLGEFTVRRGDVLVPADAWPTQKSISLFKLLVTERGRWVGAARLMETLWPALPTERAQNNLWVTVGQARRVLEPHMVARASSTYILSEKEGYRFNTGAPYSLDAEAFERLVDTGLEADEAHRLIVLEAARALYRGDYLPDDRAERWAQPTRAALLDRYLVVLGALAVLYIRLGRHRDALAACRDGLRRDGTRPELARLLMLGSALLGEHEAAQRAYAEHRAALAAAGAAPEAETEELLRRIRLSPIADPVDLLPAAQPGAQAGRRSLERPPLVGRERELRLLERALARTREHRREFVFVEGEPGSGRSRLIEEFAARAGAQGMQVLAEACYEADRAAPYRATAALLAAAHARWPNAVAALPASTRAELAILCPALAPPAHAADEVANLGGRGRLPRALAAYLGALAGENGLLICLDDLHFADAPTLRLLLRLAEGTGGPPVLVVGAYGGEELARHPPLVEFMQQIRRREHVGHIPLGRLGEDQVDHLVHTLAGGRSDTAALAAWLYRAGAGNLFFTFSLLRDLAEEGLLPLKGAHAWQVDPARLPEPDPALTLPEALRASLRERVHRLPAAARRILECAAVVGRPTGAALFAQLCPDEEATLRSRLDDLVRRGLLRVANHGAGDAYAFSHGMIGEVVYGAIGTARRAALHTTLGELLARDDACHLFPSLPALHFEEGQQWERAVLWLDKATQRALQLAARQEALNFCTRAIALGRAHPEETPPALLLELTELRGRIRIQMGCELPGAAEDLEEVIGALNGCDPGRSFDLRLVLGGALANDGLGEDARAQFDEALSIADALGDPARRVEVFCSVGTLALQQGEIARASAHFGDALALCGAHGLDGRPYARALHGRGELDWMAGAPRAALRCYEESIGVARRAGQRDLEEKNLRTIGWVCTGSLGVADYVRARALFEESLALNDGAEPWHLPLTLSALGHVLACTGDYTGGLARLRAALELALGRGQHNFGCMIGDLLGDLYSDLGLHELALGAYEAALAASTAGETGMWLPRARANAAAARIRLGSTRAREDLEVALDRSRAAGQTLHALRALEALAELGVATRDAHAALHFANALCNHATREGMRELTATALRWRGGALALQGRRPAALDDLHEALTLAMDTGRVRLQWEAHAALADLHRGEDDELARTHAAAAQALLAQTAARLEDPALRVGLLALHRQLDER